MVVAARQTGLAPGQRPAAAGLAEWAARTGRRYDAEPSSGGLRFAFYGRVATEDWQDPVTSRARQLDQATALTAGYGRITREYFDQGHSRALPWARRPQPPRCWPRWPTPAAATDVTGAAGPFAGAPAGCWQQRAEQRPRWPERQPRLQGLQRHVERGGEHGRGRAGAEPGDLPVAEPAPVGSRWPSRPPTTPGCPLTSDSARR